MPFKALLAAAMVAIGTSYATSIPIPRDQVFLAPQSPIHLAVGPRCGPLSGDTYADVNAGIDPLQFKTIVSFGVNRQSIYYYQVIEIFYPG